MPRSDFNQAISEIFDRVSRGERPPSLPSFRESIAEIPPKTEKPKPLKPRRDAAALRAARHGRSTAIGTSTGAACRRDTAPRQWVTDEQYATHTGVAAWWSRSAHRGALHRRISFGPDQRRGSQLSTNNVKKRVLRNLAHNLKGFDRQPVFPAARGPEDRSLLGQ